MSVSDPRLDPHLGAPADVIPIQYHAQMLVDEHRMSSFEAAIDEVVRPGMRVIDLGAGTGVLSYFAARRGATVIAVEREPGVFAVARAAMAATEFRDRVQLVHADARDFLPDEPVDVVVCEMLHVGLLRERQIEVIGDFKRRYRQRFGSLPRFIPEACVQAVQPVRHDFTYHGYTVPAPQFQDAFATQPRTTELAAPQVFQQFYYSDDLPTACTADLQFTVGQAGELNAIRMITKNLLAIRSQQPGSIDWLMGYLILPLAAPLLVEEGTEVQLRFQYQPGDELDVTMRNASAQLL
jgi:protein arginine N-methyltransferase 1